MPPVRLGTRMPCEGLLDASAPRLFADDPQLGRHIGTPWLRDYLRERHGLATDLADVLPEDTLQPFMVEADDLSMHAILIGASGSGKTRLALHLLREQLRQGCSAVFMDVKEDTVLQAMQCARDAGMGAEQITLLWPQERRGGMPQWNLLAGDPDEAVGLFLDAMKTVFADAWGYRLSHLLRSAATVASAQGLSLREMVELLRDPEYAEGLLRQAKENGAWDAYPEQHRAFARDYHTRSESIRKEYAGPVLNKVHSFVTDPWMQALFCCEDDTLDLPGLWKTPRLIAAHLDATSLGEESVALLAALLASSLYATALRRPGPVPVVLVLDELDRHERNVGRALLDILRRARQQGLRLIAATQTFSSVSPSLVAELLGNTWLRAFFNVGPDDADKVASALVTGRSRQPARVQLTPHSEGGVVQEATATYPLTYPDGRPIAVRPDVWDVARQRKNPHASVRLLLGMAGIPTPHVAGIPLGKAQLFVSDSWDAYAGPDPLRLTVHFPRPDVRELSASSQTGQAGELSRLLQALPPRRAVLRLRDGTLGLVQVQRTEFDAPLPDPSWAMASGQPFGLPAETSRRKANEIEALSVQEPAPPPKAARGKGPPTQGPLPSWLPPPAVQPVAPPAPPQTSARLPRTPKKQSTRTQALQTPPVPQSPPPQPQSVPIVPLAPPAPLPSSIPLALEVEDDGSL